jgi:hypothetical protein
MAGESVIPSAGGGSPTSSSDVVIEVRYKYDSDFSSPYQAYIYVYIICEETYTVPFPLTSAKARLLGNLLYSNWGIATDRDGKKCRYDYDVIAASSWEELEEKVHKRIKRIRDTLVLVKNENLAKIRTQPPDFITILQI